jgi:hypothetical protein
MFVMERCNIPLPGGVSFGQDRIDPLQVFLLACQDRPWLEYYFRPFGQLDFSQRPKYTVFKNRMNRIRI